ncbi:MAG: hypothetical protein IIC01_12700 [Planctomycetes bacterium]|nr:hypothetical protein [Planctomycetota bacterium]
MTEARIPKPGSRLQTTGARLSTHHPSTLYSQCVLSIVCLSAAITMTCTTPQSVPGPPIATPKPAARSLTAVAPSVETPKDRRILYLPLKLRSDTVEQDNRVASALRYAGWFTDVIIVAPSWQRNPNAPRNPIVRRALRIARAKGIRVIWGRWLWVAWPSDKLDAPMPDAESHFDAAYYATAIATLKAEARSLGAVATFLDAEPYGISTQKPTLKFAHLDDNDLIRISRAIEQAVRYAGRVDMIYPTTSARSTHYAWPIADLGPLDVDAKTYYLDDPNGRVVVRPPSGYEHHRGDWLWGSFVTRESEQVGATGPWTLSIAKAKRFDMSVVRKRFPKCKGRFFYLKDGDALVQTLRAWGE